MTRFDDPLFDPRLADWLEEDPNTAPEQALDVVLASFPSINQRRAMRVPWRNRSMTSTLRLGLAAAVVVAATVGGLYLLSSRTGPSVAAPETSPPAQSASAVCGAVDSGRQPDDVHLRPVRLFRRVPRPLVRGAGDRGMDRRWLPRTRRAMGRPVLRPEQPYVRPDRRTAEARGLDGRGVRDGLHAASSLNAPRAPFRGTPGPMRPSGMHRPSAPSSSAEDLLASR